MKLKITFLVMSADYAGGFRVISTYARMLQDRGHDVLIVTLPPMRAPLRARVRTFFRSGFPSLVSGPRGSFADDLGIRVKVLERSRPIVAADLPDADIVIATWWETAEWAAALPASKGVGYYFVQGDEATIPGQPAERVAATMQLPLRKIVVAEWLKNIARAGRPAEPIWFVPNSVDTDLFFSAPRRKSETLTAGFVYSDVSIKGPDIAIQALTEAKCRLPDLRALSFGGGSGGRVRPKDLPSWIEFFHRPPQNTLRDLYASADVWLWTSRREGFGLPILEAMACRTPVIATPAGAAPELVDESVGRLMTGWDGAEVQEALVEFARMPADHWARISESALSRALSYTWVDAVDLFEEALEQFQSSATSASG